jgi:hypothetical protein
MRGLGVRAIEIHIHLGKVGAASPGYLDISSETSQKRPLRHPLVFFVRTEYTLNCSKLASISYQSNYPVIGRNLSQSRGMCRM